MATVELPHPLDSIIDASPDGKWCVTATFEVYPDCTGKLSIQEWICGRAGWYGPHDLSGVDLDADAVARLRPILLRFLEALAAARDA